MPFDVWVSYALLHLLVCLIPGPMVLVVVSEGLSGGLRRSAATIAGILIVNATYLVLAALGVGATLLAFPTLFSVLRWVGIVYLLWLARQLWTAVPGDASRTPSDTLREARTSFLRGLVVQFANPGALLFFLALLPQFISPALPVGVQFAILGLTSIAIEALVLLAYGGGVARAAAFLRRPAAFMAFNRVAAGLLVVAAGWSALASRK